MMDVVIDEVESPIGIVTLACADGALRALAFEPPGRIRALLGARGAALPMRPARDPHGLSTRIKAYLDGDLSALATIPVEAEGTPFQREVWSAVRRIPPGATRSYREIAADVGRPAAARAVGAANARNPVCLVIPCHRVIGAGGDLTGYAGGVERKRWLLAHEGACGRVVPGTGVLPSGACAPARLECSFALQPLR